MHAHHLAAIANWAAFNNAYLLQQDDLLTTHSCSPFWTQSKCRQNRWMTALKMFENDVANLADGHNPWPATEIVIQEIFLAEILTRVWSASMVGHDMYYQKSELTGLAHSIHIGHLEAKNRAMRLLLSDDSVDATIFDRLNTLRRKSERWTDLLLGQLELLESAQQFAFQVNRVKDFHAENREQSFQQLQTHQFLCASSMTEDLRQCSVRFSANPEANRRIASAILGCFPSDRFDACGLPKSVQLLWIERSSDTAELLFHNLNDLDKRPADDILEIIQRHPGSG